MESDVHDYEQPRSGYDDNYLRVFNQGRTSPINEDLKMEDEISEMSDISQKCRIITARIFDSKRLVQIQVLVMIVSMANLMGTYQQFDFANFERPNQSTSSDFYSNRDYPSFMLLITFSLGVLVIHVIKRLVSPLQNYNHLALRFHLILLVIAYPLYITQT